MTQYSRVSESESCSFASNSLQPHGPVHGILQTRILEWVAFPFSRGSSQPRDRTQVSQTVGRFFTSWAIGEVQYSHVSTITIMIQNCCITAESFLMALCGLLPLPRAWHFPIPVTVPSLELSTHRIQACAIFHVWLFSLNKMPLSSSLWLFVSGLCSSFLLRSILLSRWTPGSFFH